MHLNLNANAFAFVHKSESAFNHLHMSALGWDRPNTLKSLSRVLVVIKCALTCPPVSATFSRCTVCIQMVHVAHLGYELTDK